VILPGLISLAFYRRRPSALQIALGLIATVALSAILGYFSPAGPLGREGSVLVAVAGGVILYVAILAFFFYRYQAKSTETPTAPPPSTQP
jgi:uncharacterized membrane-anchored protein